MKVVIIENDPMVAQINHRYLDTASDVQVAGVFDNGENALGYILENEPDLAILDFYVPGLDGIELLRRMREAEVGTDVVMVTAASDAPTVESALRLGVVDYILKPFEYERFMEAIERYRKRKNVFRNAQALSQDCISSLFSLPCGISQNPSRDLKKGLQQRTLDMVRRYLATIKGQTCSCDSLAEHISLSKVTVRRYLNYLAEINEIDSSVNYQTGGRPCIKYTIPLDS